MLPRGSRIKIKDDTTFSYSYIDQVLKGTRFNLAIINKALDILKELQLSQKSTSNKFHQIISTFNGANKT